jgi:hypothetical protein
MKQHVKIHNTDSTSHAQNDYYTRRIRSEEKTDIHVTENKHRKTYEINKWS